MLLLLALAETTNRHLLTLIMDETIRANMPILHRTHVKRPQYSGQ